MGGFVFPRIHAHRGFSEEAPESTLFAFKLAADNGVDGIEFDLHYTKDCQIVVHHDYYLGRTSNGCGLLSDKTYEELRSLDVGSWFNIEYKRERIPLFHEVLELVGNRSNLEIQLASLSEDFIFETVNTITRYNLLNTVEITSSFPHVLMKVREYSPEIKIGVFLQPEGTWMFDDLWISLAVQTMSLINANVAHVSKQRLNSDNVLKLKEKGYVVHASDCNDIDHLKLAVDLGVDQISTDKVKQALLLKNESLKNI